MKIAVVIETKDRRLHDGVNYIGQTLRNLNEVGFWTSPFLHSLQIVCGGEQPDFLPTEVFPFLPAEPTTDRLPYIWPCPDAGRTRQQNAATAIRAGADTNADWVLKLEDDLDFIDNFLDATAYWLMDHGSAAVPMFSLAATFAFVSQSKYETPGESVLGAGSSFPGVRSMIRRGDAIAAHPVNGFWGAQALVWRRSVAGQLADWLGDDPFLWDGKEEHRQRGHDLLLQVWGNSLKAKAFGVAIPSFVQHIGQQSNIANRFFEFPWPGRGWTYERRTYGEV